MARPTLLSGRVGPYSRARRAPLTALAGDLERAETADAMDGWPERQRVADDCPGMGLFSRGGVPDCRTSARPGHREPPCRRVNHFS
jgi:hypothetical protein